MATYHYFRWKTLCSVFLGVVIVYGLYFLASQIDSIQSTYLLLRGSTVGIPTHTKFESCTWSEADPQLYHLKLSEHVNFFGSHWFHVAENVLVQHSILRKKDALSTSSEVFLDFERVNFVNELNGVTRFLIAMGITNGQVNKIHFTHGTNNLDFSRLAPGITFKVDVHEQRRKNMDFEWNAYSLDKNAAERFLVPSKEHEGMKCVKYMGTFGGEYPTPQRGHWFPRTGDVSTFREKIASLCPATSLELAEYKKTKPYKMVIYQRDLSRKIAELRDAMELIHNQLDLNQWEIQVKYHQPNEAPCQLVASLANVDVLISSHGFQSMLELFLPQPAVLFEIFPYKYYKRAYGVLAKEYGIIHVGVMSPPVSITHEYVLSFLSTDFCMKYITCRSFARDDDVILTPHGMRRLEEGIAELVEMESKGSRNFIYEAALPAPAP